VAGPQLPEQEALRFRPIDGRNGVTENPRTTKDLSPCCVRSARDLRLRLRHNLNRNLHPHPPPSPTQLPVPMRCTIACPHAVHPEVVGSGCRAATTPPALSGRSPLGVALWRCLCAAGRGATRRSATSSTTHNFGRHRSPWAQAPGDRHPASASLASQPLPCRSPDSAPAASLRPSA
jgi:hypothetical protein